jgi:hypothetical protein
MTVLMAMVEPCTKLATFESGTPLFSRQLRMPSERSSGVVGLLAPKSRPSSSS